MAPTIFIVPGIYEGPTVFEPLRSVLEGYGYAVHLTRLPSTGTASPGNPTMDDDVAAIAADLAAVVARAGAHGVVVVCHSAGGFLGSAAMRGLTAGPRRAGGKEGGGGGGGGVIKMVFLAAGIGPEGLEHKPQPFMEFHEGKGYQTCRDPLTNFFHDLPPAEAEKWLGHLKHQPSDWDGTINFCGWREVPSVYIICEQDKIIPRAIQEHLAVMAGSQIVSVDSGHMAQLSNTNEVARIIKEAVEQQLG